MVSIVSSCELWHAYFYLSDNDVDSYETQADDPDLTYMPEDNYLQVIPDSLEPEG